MKSQKQPPFSFFSHLLSVRVTSPRRTMGWGPRRYRLDPSLSSEHGTESRQIVARSRQAAQVAPAMGVLAGLGSGLWALGKGGLAKRPLRGREAAQAKLTRSSFSTSGRFSLSAGSNFGSSTMPRDAARCTTTQPTR